MKRHIPALLTSCLFAQSAFAGGLSDPIIPVPLPPVPIVVPLDWYVGLQAGNMSGDATPEIPDTAFPETAIEGPIYGVHAGVQRAFGAITAGVELDYNTAPDPFEEDDSSVTVEMDTLAHLKLRAGGNFGPAFVYGTAGLAYFSGMVEPIGGPVDVTDTAPFFGLGADVMVTQSISIGAEVLKHDFEDIDDSGVDLDFTTAMLRVSYHF